MKIKTKITITGKQEESGFKILERRSTIENVVLLIYVVKSLVK